MAVGVKAWSVTAGSNSNSDTGVNWAEGQLAPTVNNSARAMMASIKAFVDGIGANAVSYGGAASAYTITNQTVGVWSAYTAPSIIALKANHTNAGAATVNVDGLGAQAIRTSDGGALVAGDIVSGGIYLLIYDGTNFQVVNTLAGGDFQARDATLTALAAIVGTSGQVAYWTGTDSFSLFDTTSFGRSISNAADAAALKTLAGLANVENKSSATIRGEITSGNVTTALTYTPYNATNPSGYITGINSGNVTTALGYTPYNATNPSGYISSINSGNVTTALGYTPWNAASGGSIGASISVTGDITASGNVSAYSDGRLKEDFAPLTGALERVCRMQGLSFTMKQDGKRAIGFIAQDLEAIQPLLVKTNEDGIKSVFYANITAELVEAIKELHEKVQRLGER